jgi:hypothetical protein
MWESHDRLRDPKRCLNGFCRPLYPPNALPDWEKILGLELTRIYGIGLNSEQGVNPNTMQLNEQIGKTERAMGDFSSNVVSRLESNHLNWQHLKGSPQFDYPIDYSVAVIRADRASDQIEFLAKWAPNAYCHYHRHLGRASSWVIQGEHNIVETTETRSSTRLASLDFEGKVRWARSIWNMAEQKVQPSYSSARRLTETCLI